MAAASDNSDLHGSETMENGSAHPEFIAWIILDEELVPISQPLQNLFESGLVDFSRHINVRLLSQALAMPTSTATSQSTGISHLSFISQPSTNNLNNIVHDELSLEDALLQLSNIEDEETAFEEQSQHGYSQFLYRK
ncbi:hypothetical protein EC957_004276 [Mortierella hygrophila]|uniref:Uncharacterized protein n=1 Tax=Mortierella hygrophila TaxID=979708 RepID=A0A9P6FF61_9FUNG|nr:hypothetical protein EC957_004276 [Mortierella hygrophila]